MTGLRTFWRTMFDVRTGEYLRATCMTLYLMLVLFAYYILKPVSRAIFLNKFDIDKLPWLYVLIAGVGGVLAYLYTKLVVKTSLRHAVDFATLFSLGVLVGFWWLIQLNIAWIVYAFNIWVSLFSIILVSQGWLIAANIFTTLEAKRLYGILGVGSVIGAAFGGTFTAFMVRIIGTTNLILACAGMVALSYIPFLFLVRDQKRVLATARAATADEEDFTFGEIVSNLRRHRHLQVIMAIMVVTFIIDVMVEYQFNAAAKIAYQNKNDLTAFLGNFYGFWLNLVTFVCQFFLTGFVIRRFGVGGTLQIMPVSIALASIAALLFPSVLSAAATRLTEASTRYSFNKTGMELLYLPLPLDLRNRTKAFVDIFVDRFSRGIGGMILVLVTVVIGVSASWVAVMVLCFAGAWILLSIYGKKEYIATVRHRLEARRLEFESIRVPVEDPATIALLEEAARNGNPRQTLYALSVLSQSSSYRFQPLLRELAKSSSPEVRARVYDLALSQHDRSLIDAAEEEIRRMQNPANPALAQSAAKYVLSFTPDARAVAATLLQHPSLDAAEGAVSFLALHSDYARDLLSNEWLNSAAQSGDPARRRLAALAVRARGDRATEALQGLINDPDPAVASAAFQSAASLKNREYAGPIALRLPDPHVRGAAIEALAAFGEEIIGTLESFLCDASRPLALRRQIPRALRLIPAQRSVDVLLACLTNSNSVIRGAALRALGRLRENAPDLDYGAESVTAQIMLEARRYFEYSAALAAFREKDRPLTPAGLLVNTLETRLKECLERLFRLLGLKYPPRQIYAAYMCLNRGGRDDAAAAIEFLDNVLERDLKRVIAPILDDPSLAAQRGRDLFGIEIQDVESTLRELLRWADEWLVACAISTAAQLRLSALAPEITEATGSGEGDVSQVARDAIAVLA